MSDLAHYVLHHTQRDGCRCGRCIDLEAGDGKALTEHTADMIFFKVALRAHEDKLPEKEEFIKLVKAHKGAYGDVDLFDEKEHGYIELGGWIGDQQIALRLMALGTLLGVWMLLSPKTVLGDTIDDDTALVLAGKGMVTILYHKQEAAAVIG